METNKIKRLKERIILIGAFILFCLILANIVNADLYLNSRTGSVYLNTSNTARMQITSGGNLVFLGLLNVSLPANLTVDTNTLFVDSVNDRVGVGTTAPTEKLVVVGNANVTGNLFADNITIQGQNGSLWQPVYGSDDGLLLYLPFSDGNYSNSSNVFDRSPYGIDGICYGVHVNSTCNATNGKYGQALQFDGLNDYVYINSGHQWSKKTTELWYYHTQSQSSTLIANAISGDGAPGSRIELSGNNVRLRWLNPSASQESEGSTALIPGRWYHLVSIFDNRTSYAAFYINGEKVYDTTAFKPYSTHASTDQMVIGANYYVAVGLALTAIEYANATIDEVRVYNRQLAPEEIRAHYLRGTGSGAVSTISADRFRIINRTGGRVLELNQSAFAVHTAGAERLKIDSSGNVGIGTTSPLQKLHVEGQCVAEDTLISLADGSKKKIKDVKEGDLVQSLDEATGKIVSNKVNALLDMGNKTIFEIKTESNRAVNTTGNHPYLTVINNKEKCDDYLNNGFNNNIPESWTTENSCLRWVQVSELKEKDKIAVSSYKPSSFISSEVENTSTPYFANAFNLASLDQRAILYPLFLNDKHKAIYGASLICPNNISRAFDLESCQNLSGNTFMNVSRVFLGNSYSTSDIPAFLQISALCLSNSANNLEGAINSKSYLESGSITTSLTAEPFLKNENRTLASTTSSIYSKPSFLYLLYMPSFTFLPNIRQSSSVNLEFSNNLFKADNKMCFLALSPNSCLTAFSTTSDHITSGCLDTSSFKSSETLNLSSAILPSKYDGDNEIYKLFGLELSDITFEEIKSITVHSPQQVYDLAIEGTHNFIANDIIAHNTFVTGFVNFTNNTAFNQTLYLVNGNVGIGTTSPANTLTVVDSGTTAANPLINFTDTSGSAYLEIGSTGTGSASALQMRKYTTGQNWRMGLGAQSGTDMIEFYDAKNSIAAMVIANGTGNVGIGTTSPLQKLHVEGQCVAEDTLISLADGSKKKIKDIKEGDLVQSLDEATGKIVSNKVNALLDMGNKTIFELKTESGRAVNTTAEHPYLTIINDKAKCDGYLSNRFNNDIPESYTSSDSCLRWVQVSELKEDDYIGVPKAKDFVTNVPKPSLRGNVNTKNNLSSISFVVMLKGEEFNNSLGFVNFKLQNKTFKYMNSSFTSEIVPQRLVMGRIEDNFSHLLSDNFSQDMILSASLINTSLTSWHNIHDIIHLYHFISSKNSSTDLYLIGFSFFADSSLLIDSSFNGSSSTGCQSILSQNSQSSSVISPVCLYLSNMSRFINLTTALAMDLESNLSSSSINNSAILLSPNTESKNNYLNVAESDIFFDKITSIKLHSPQQVYDLAIEGTHNFIANDIIAHNTFVTGFVNFTNNTAFNQTLYLVNGNVGIGTTSPGRLLEVSGAINGTALNISGPTNLAYGTGNVGIGTTAPASKMEVAGTFNATSSSTQFLVNSNGDIVINLKG